MRFISHIRRFSVQVQERKFNIVGNGVEQETQPQIIAEFWQGDITAAELAWAETAWKKAPGRTTEMDTVTMTPLLGRLSIFDTEQAQKLYGWDDKTRVKVEEKLSATAQGSADFAVVEVPALTPPWPRYNDFRGSVDDLVQRVLDDGYFLPEVVEYEKENLNRRDIISALQSAHEAIMAEAGGVPTGDVIPA